MGAHDHEGEDHREHDDGDDGAQLGHGERQPSLAPQQAHDVAGQAEEGGLGEADHASLADEKTHAHGQEAEVDDAHERRDGVLGCIERHEDEGRDDRDAREQPCPFPTRPAHDSLPNSPCGRTARTIAMGTKTRNIEISGA